jgi:hypothetical protein
MIQAKHKVIDGIEYTVTQFPARRGFKLKLTLAKKLLPGMSRLLDSGTPLSQVMESNIGSGSVVSAIQAAVDSLDEEEAVKLIMELLSSTRRGTKDGRGGLEISEEILDMEYAGNYLALYKVIAYVLEVNYSDFFKGIGKVASTIVAPPVAPAEPTPL